MRSSHVNGSGRWVTGPFFRFFSDIRKALRGAYLSMYSFRPAARMRSPPFTSIGTISISIRTMKSTLAFLPEDQENTLPNPSHVSSFST